MKAQSDLAGDRESAAETAAPAERRVTIRMTDEMKTNLFAGVHTAFENLIPATDEFSKKLTDLMKGAGLDETIPHMNFGEVTSPPAPATAR